MDQTQHELTFDESVKQVMQSLPPVIRDYLAQGRYTAVAKNVMTKYGLHLDQGGILEREIMLLLMGVEDPTEFGQALAEEARLDQKTINGIMQDVNNQIFIPLRDEMRNAPAPAPQPPKPVTPPPTPPTPVVAPAPTPPMPVAVPAPAPVAPAAPAPSSAPVTEPQGVNIFAPRTWTPPKADPVPGLPDGTYAPPLQSPRYPNQENISSYVRTVAFKRPQPINRIQPPVRTTQPPATPTAPSAVRAAPPSLAEVPKDVGGPPPNLPGTTPEQQPSTPLNASLRTMSGEHSVGQNVVAPRPYSSDPYHEPIEGEESV